jgi:hypothetical protein
VKKNKFMADVETLLSRKPENGHVTFTDEEWKRMQPHLRTLHATWIKDAQPKKPRFDPN